MAGFRYRLVCCTVFFVRYSSGMWHGIFCMVLVRYVVRYFRYGLVWQGSVIVWYVVRYFCMVLVWFVVRYFSYGTRPVCGTVFSGMWYGIFCMVRYGLVYKGCGQTDRQANLHSPKQSLSFTN